MAKPVIKFKTYRQALAVGGKIYGVPNLGDPVVAEVTMQEVIDYAKLHNYSAETLSALLSQVISGVGDLVARDGRPRMLSDLLKFEPVIKGTFDNLEQTVTNQKVLVRPRMLKEIKVALDPSKYSWQNQNDGTSPRLISVAPAKDGLVEVNLATFTAALDAATGFGWTYAGSRLCPNGYDANCSFAVLLRRSDPTLPVLHFEQFDIPLLGTSGAFLHGADDEASDNTLKLSRDIQEPGAENAVAWYQDAAGEYQILQTVTPAAGDVVVFQFTRTTSTGDTFTVEKSYTL